MSSDIVIEILDETTTATWDAYVQASEKATFFHLSAWRDIVQKVFAHPCHYYYAQRDGQIQGVLPLGHINGPIFANALISTPFCVYGGINATDQEAGRALEERAMALAEQLGVDYLELRQLHPRQREQQTDPLYVTYRKTIPDDPEAILKAIPRKQRAMVRKGIKAGLVGEVDASVDRFYALYAESLRNLGTPILPKKWFSTIKETFSENCQILTITHEGRPISSVMSYYFRDQVLPYYAGGGDDARRFKANDFMYYDLMCRAREAGYILFDFGRSKLGSGSNSFKRNWGFEAQPLYYDTHLIRAMEKPELNPNNPKYQYAIAAWKKLPVGVSQFLGPFISKYLA